MQGASLRKARTGIFKRISWAPITISRISGYCRIILTTWFIRTRSHGFDRNASELALKNTRTSILLYTVQGAVNFCKNEPAVKFLRWWPGGNTQHVLLHAKSFSCHDLALMNSGDQCADTCLYFKAFSLKGPSS